MNVVRIVIKIRNANRYNIIYRDIIRERYREIQKDLLSRRSLRLTVLVGHLALRHQLQLLQWTPASVRLVRCLFLGSAIFMLIIDSNLLLCNINSFIALSSNIIHTKETVICRLLKNRGNQEYDHILLVCAFCCSKRFNGYLTLCNLIHHFLLSSTSLKLVTLFECFQNMIIWSQAH